MSQTTATKWSIDPAHSEVQFKVKHLGISSVAGTFKTFSGYAETTGEDLSGARVHFEISTDSIDTNHTERDGHLRSELFFNTQKFPAITFDGQLQKKGEHYELQGDLTILETTKNVRLEADFTGSGKGRFGDTRAGFEVNGKVNRKEFGLSWSLLTDAGSLVVGEEVRLHFDIQLIRQAD